ncbi:MAG: hypothetical protein ABI539_03865, partial [Acidobacteriota bacterium]
MADVQTSPETVDIKRGDGTRFKSVVVKPDKEARSAAANNETREDHTANGQRSIRSIALTAKSVAGGQFIKGIVYFRRIKKANFILFSIKMDGITYLFQLPRGTHRQKRPVT